MAKDYADIICEAVDEIVSQRLKDVSFDTTIECIIVDASEAKQGKYTCSNGSAKFVAYSENTKYKKNEAVLVSIPQGDYNKQKTIISKQVTDKIQSVKFQKPFDTIVDSTSNLIKDDQGTTFFIANQNYVKNQSTQGVSLKEIWQKAFDEPLCGYTKLGLQAQFMSWLKGFKAKEGNYGLMVRIVAKSAETATSNDIKEEISDKILDETSELDFFADGKILAEDLLEDKLDILLSEYNLTTTLSYTYVLRIYADNFLRYYRENDSKEKSNLRVKLKELLISQVYNLLLDCKDMFGDVYNYETYSEQEKVFDISGLDILNIALYFYQNNNFYTYNNESVKIPIPFSDEFGNLLPPNLFVKDPYLCLGLSLDSFDGDSATLYTVDRLGYDKKLTDEENTKNIQLRWVHYYENENQYSVINKDSELKFDVRWYRYKTGAPSADQYSGMYWERTNLGITKTETRVKELELTEINNLKTYYLLFHYSPGSTSNVASEQTYTQNFIPEYTIEKTQNINKGLSASNNYSHMSYWTDECLNKYNISKDLAQHAFAGQHTTSITKYVDQSWEDIYKQGFVFHDQNWNYSDYYTGKRFPVPSGCMHKVGFWEKFTLAYRLYWVYPEQFALLLGNKDVWKTGGSNPTGVYDEFGKWQDFSGKNLYSDFGYKSNSLALTNFTNFQVNSNANNTPIRQIFTLFTDSFGEWEYVTDEYGMKDYVPKDISTRNRLTEALELFYKKMDNPIYEEYYEVFIAPDLFQYNFIPDTNLAEEQIKVIILNDDKIIRSNILRFTHDGDVVNKVTIDNLSALGIICEDGSFGNYYIYSLGNELIDKSNKDEVRFLKCVLDSKEYIEESTDLTEAEQITWYFPINNTMIYPYLYNWSIENPVNKIIEIPTNFREVFKPADNKYYNSNFELVTGETGYYLYKENDLFPNPLYYNDGKIKSIILYNANTSQLEITHFGSESDNNYHTIPTNKVNYMIKNYYNLSASNNIVQCQIIKDRVTYTAMKQLFFGTSGTSGTDVTLTINFNNNESALTIGRDANGYAKIEEACVLNAKLYNQQGGMPVDLNNISNSNNSLGFNFDWKWFCADTTRKTKKYKRVTDYYPVIFVTEDIQIDSSNDFQASVIYKNFNTLEKSGNDYLLTDDYYYYDRNQQKFISSPGIYNSNNIYYQKKEGDKINYRLMDGNDIITESNYARQTYYILYEGRYLLDDYHVFNPVLTYYSPIRDEINYTTSYLSLEEYRDEDGTLHPDQIEIKINSGVQSEEKLSDEAIMNSVFILQLTLTGWGDYPLVAYKPIALRRNLVEKDDEGNDVITKYDCITGDTHVIYNSAGDGVVCKEPYKLWKYPKIAGQEIAENGFWKVYVPYYEGENYTNKLNFVGVMSNNNILQPPTVYVSNAPQYSVQFELANNGGVVWTQPILTIQNNYPSEMLNNWDGKEIKTDNETGTIMASAISAGKKESDNTFSGVVIGDWSRSNTDASIKSQTGVYGFHHGSMSYALKEDGTAFFGKAGKGRIHLDGTKSQIYSSNWLNPNKSAPQGMLMDLDDGYVKMQNGGGLSVVPLTEEDYSELDYKIFKQVNYLLRTEKASDTLYFDKQQGNEIFLDQYGHLNTDTSSYDSKTMDQYFEDSVKENRLDRFFLPKYYASKALTKSNYVPDRYYVYASKTIGEADVFDYYLVPSGLSGVKSKNDFEDLLTEFNSGENSFYIDYDFYIPSAFENLNEALAEIKEGYDDIIYLEQQQHEKDYQASIAEYEKQKAEYDALVADQYNINIARPITQAMIDSFDYEHENGDRTFYYGNIVFNTAGLISNIAELYEIYDAKTDKEYAPSDLLNLKYYHYWLNQEIAKPEGYDDLYNGEIYEGLPPEPTHPGPQPEFKPSMTYDEYIELYGYGENFNYKEKYYYTYYNGYQLINPAEEIYDPEMVYYKESEAQHITLSSSLSNYWPLAIGTDLSEGSRNFRVSWDGTLYSTNGHFTGEINALSGTLGNLDVAGTLNGGNIYGAYIHGAEIEGGSISSGDAFISDGIISGATLKGSTIYFGQGAGYTYKVYDSKGNLIRTRTYAAPLDELQKGDLTYVLDPDAEIDAAEIGVLRDVYGNDGHGTTHGVELAVTNKDYFLRLANEGRILIKSTGAETDSWVALNAGPDWDYSKGGGHVVVQPDGSVYINATKIKFETAKAEHQEGIYARFAPDDDDDDNDGDDSNDDE